MQQEKTLPITWKSWDSIDILCNYCYDVEFTENFGVFSEGDKFNSISINYAEGIIEAYNENGTEVVKKQEYKCKPI